MKFYCKLNNYQFGSYPFNTLHQYITKNVKLDRNHKYIELEVTEPHEINWVKVVDKHLSGANFGTRQQIKELK